MTNIRYVGPPPLGRHTEGRKGGGDGAMVAVDGVEN